MRPLLRIFVPLAVLAATLLPQETVIRVEVRLVRILATVRNTAGELVVCSSGTISRFWTTACPRN